MDTVEDSSKGSPTVARIKETIKRAERTAVQKMVVEALNRNLEAIRVEEFKPGCFRVRFELDVTVSLEHDLYNKMSAELS